MPSPQVPTSLPHVVCGALQRLWCPKGWWHAAATVIGAWLQSRCRNKGLASGEIPVSPGSNHQPRALTPPPPRPPRLLRAAHPTGSPPRRGASCWLPPGTGGTSDGGTFGHRHSRTRRRAARAGRPRRSGVVPRARPQTLPHLLDDAAPRKVTLSGATVGKDVSSLPPRQCAQRVPGEVEWQGGRVCLHLGAWRDGPTDREPARGLDWPPGSLDAPPAPLSYPGEPSLANA